MKRIVALFFLIIFTTLSAEVIEPELTEKNFTIGQKFQIPVDIKPGEKLSAALTSKSDSVAIVSAVPSEDKLKTVVNLVALKSGETEIPDIELNVDGKIHTVKSFKVTVTENTAESDMNLRDIKKPVKIMEKDYTLLYVAGVLILAILIVLLIVFLIKKFQKKAVEVPVVVTSLDIANKYLKMARAAKASGDFESYVDHLTVGIRAYMSHKSSINYAEMTTSEVRRKLRKDNNFSKFNDKIIGLLRLGDRFKFADEMLKEEDFDELYNGFKEIVDEVS